MADFSCLPMGFGFSPTDEDIIAIIIMIVDKNPQAAVYNSVIHECSLFGHICEPSEIWKHFGGDQAHGQQLFFLSKLKRSPKNISRKIGLDGTWSESGNKEIECNTNPNLIGKMRNFRFENKCKSGDHARWLLDEYSLYDAAAAHDNTKASKNRYDFDIVICRMRKKDGENKRKRSNDLNTNNVEPQEGYFTTDHLVLPLPDESNERKRMSDVACHNDPVNVDMLITNPTNTFSIEEQLAHLYGYQCGIASSENLPPDQMAETLEDVPLWSLGSARLGADEGQPHHPLEDHQPKDHQNVTLTNVENTYPALDGNHEERLPWPTADSAWPYPEDGGAIGANYQIPSNIEDMIINQPVVNVTYDFEDIDPILLW